MDKYHIYEQSAKARVRPYADIRRMTGDTYDYDGIGIVEARNLKGRINLKEWDDLENERREIIRIRLTKRV
jgi:hypothetical protein